MTSLQRSRTTSIGGRGPWLAGIGAGAGAVGGRTAAGAATGSTASRFAGVCSDASRIAALEGRGPVAAAAGVASTATAARDVAAAAPAPPSTASSSSSRRAATLAGRRAGRLGHAAQDAGEASGARGIGARGEQPAARLGLGLGRELGQVAARSASGVEDVERRCHVARLVGVDEAADRRVVGQADRVAHGRER